MTCLGRGWGINIRQLDIYTCGWQWENGTAPPTATANQVCHLHSGRYAKHGISFWCFFQEAARTRTNSFQYKTYMLKVESKSIYIDINIFLYLYILYVYVCGNKEYMLHRCVSVLIWQIKDQSSSNLFHILGFIVNQVKLVRFLLHDLEIWSTTKELNKLSLNQPKWSLLMGYLPADGVMPAALHSV